jgi:hypothetical protein
MSGAIPTVERQGITMRLPHYSIVEGRRPAGLVTPASTPGASVLGDYFGRAAYLETASAFAFARLGRELEENAAPARLVEACERARLAELSHARGMARLAAAHGVTALMPTEPPRDSRRLTEIAVENIVEGFVRQTYGAAVARLRARSATDFQTRRLMEDIAHDELAHAELALEIAIWLQGVVDPLEAAFVENALRHAVVSLAHELDVDVDPELCSQVGVPSRNEALVIWSGLSKRVWAGASEQVWRAAG